MEIIRYFEENSIKQPVKIIGSSDDPLFKADDIGNIFDIKNIRSSLKHFEMDEKVYKIEETNGGKQTTTFLTEIGLYRFITMSRKPFAKKFQRWMFEVIKEIRINGKYELNTIENKMLIEKEFFEMSKKMERHKALIQGFKEQNVVYVCEMTHQFQGNTLIKIGETCDISERINCLSNQFAQPIYLLDVFKCENNHGFEQFLHKLPVFIENRFYDKFENGSSSKEIYILQNDFNLEYVKKIIKKNIEPFEKISYEDYLENQRLEVEKMKIELKQKEIELMSEINHSNQTFIKDNPDYIDILKNLSSILKNPNDVNRLKEVIQNKNLLNENSGKIFIKNKESFGPFVQKYDEKGDFIQYYNSIIICIRENKGFSQTGLKNAVKNKTIYHGFRWFLQERSKNPEEVQNIGETKEIIKQRKELIAFLNLDKNKIVKVYPDQKSITEEYKVSHGAICSAIKRGSRSQGGYFVFYEDCSQELKNTYKEELPEISPKTASIQVNQISPITEEVIKKYNSINDVINECQISRISLKKAIENNDVLKGFKWEFS